MPNFFKAVQAKSALKASVVPVGDMASPENLLKAQYINYITAKKKEFIEATRQARAKGGFFKKFMPTPPKYPTFEEWKTMMGVGSQVSLSDAMSGLGSDIFTTIGKSLKANVISVIAPAVSKVTGVSVSKVKADLNKVKTKVNLTKIATKALTKGSGTSVTPITPAPKTGTDLTPVVSVTDESPEDRSEGAPVFEGRGGNTGGRFVMPTYVLPVMGGVVLVSVLYFINKNKQTA